MKLTIKRKVPSRKRPHPLLRWSRDVFLILGVLMLGYCGFVWVDAKVYEAYQAHLFKQQLKELSASGPASVQTVSLHSFAAGTLGQIEITRLGIAAMILEGTSNRTLRRAVGHISGTSLPGQPGNVGIAGHRDTFFRELRNVRQADEITVTTFNGSYTYRVDSIQVVEPEDIQVLDNSDGDVLTLVTCYPFYYVGPAPKRFVVRAQRLPG